VSGFAARGAFTARWRLRHKIMADLINFQIVTGINDRVHHDPRFDWTKFRNEYEYIPKTKLADTSNVHLCFEFEQRGHSYLEDVLYLGLEEYNYNIAGIAVEQGDRGSQVFYGMAACFPDLFKQSGYRIWPSFEINSFPNFMMNTWLTAASQLLPLAGWTGITRNMLKVMLVWDWS